MTGLAAGQREHLEQRLRDATLRRARRLRRRALGLTSGFTLGTAVIVGIAGADATVNGIDVVVTVLAASGLTAYLMLD